ncbi:MAG TPA: RNase H-like domain-containing protein [Candidatus Dojkabacteria bacterium]|mgnify:CR=1 FL=1|nr:RNase H-like domain-containing protein [Candidatus Dojkabacteria bacterium]
MGAPDRSPNPQLINDMKSATIIKQSKFKSIITLNKPFDYKILIDTGAQDINVMKKKLFDEFKLYYKELKLKPTTIEVIPFGSKSVKPLGITTMKLILPNGQETAALEFVVVDTDKAHDIVLGTFAIEELQIKIDLTNGIVQILEEEYLLDVTPSYYSEIRAATNRNIKSGTMQSIDVYCENIYAEDNNQYYHVYPSQTLNNCKVLQMPKAVAKADLNQIYLSNFGPEDVHVHAGALLGYLSLINYPINYITEDTDLSDENITVGDAIYIPTQHDEEHIDANVISQYLQENCTNLTAQQFNRLKQTLLNAIRLFAPIDGPVGVQTKTKCHVNLEPGTVPIRLPPYRTAPVKALEIKKIVEELLERKLIEKATSAWAFPVVIVQKQDGTSRFCVDYSKLTKETIKDAYPLPRIDDTFNYLSGAKYFTVVDAASGFWQIPIHEKDKEKLAFTTASGTYQWNVMPFGFTNAPGIFQRAMNETLDDELFRCCLVYIDDIIIYSKTFEDHIKDLNKIFLLLQNFNWQLKLFKCKFAQTKIEYLGHVLENDTLTVLDKNIEKLKNAKRPKNIKETQAFLGAVNYYRRFIQGLSYIAEPLYRNLRKDQKYEWTEEHDKAFQEMIALLAKKPILKLPDYSKEFILKTDASDIGFGGALVQVHDDKEFPVSFFSGSFNPAQRRTWNNCQKEAYAVISGVAKYRNFLLENKFTIVTDNQALLSIFDPVNKSKMLNRWTDKLLEYDYVIKHRAGSKMVIEDSLSRSVNFNLINTQTIKDKQQQDKTIKGFKKLLEGNEENINEDIIKHFKLIKENLIIGEEGILYFSKTNTKATYDDLRIIIPNSLQTQIIKEYHALITGGHLGITKTYEKIKQHVWFPDMYRKIEQYIKKCDLCEPNRRYYINTEPFKPIKSTQPMEIIEIDHTGPLPETTNGNKYILSVVDHFTSKKWFIPVKTTSADDTIRALIDFVFAPFEFPRYILSDNGSAFVSEVTRQFEEFTNITPKFALPNQHNTMGSVENANKQIKDILTKFINQHTQNDWDRYIHLAAHALNKTIYQGTKYAADYLIFGRQPINPFIESADNISTDEYVLHLEEELKLAFANAKQNLQEYRDKMVDTSRKRILRKEIEIYQPEDWVYLKKEKSQTARGLSHKLDIKSTGPYKVIWYDNDTGNLTLEQADGKTFKIKSNLVHKTMAPETLPEPSHLIATHKNDIIIISNLTELQKKIGSSNEEPMDKSKATVENLVGARVMTHWNTRTIKGDFPATVIGYKSNKKLSLLFYDMRTDEGEIFTDYYAESLIGKKPVRWEFINLPERGRIQKS